MHRRTIFLDTYGYVFAADLLYHKICMIRYMVNFQRELDSVIDYEEYAVDESVTAVC